MASITIDQRFAGGCRRPTSPQTYSGKGAPLLLLYRLGPEGFYAVKEGTDKARYLHSDPFDEPPGAWQTGRPVDISEIPLLVPVHPPKIIGIGRNYVAHAKELQNPVPEEPLIFLKAPSSVIGPKAPVILPPESERVDFEGEIAVILKRTLRHADRDMAARSILGVTAACDVTARDLQRKDATFARGKSFDSFCPLGPAILVRPDLEELSVTTRINGEVRQEGRVTDMIFDIPFLISYVSRIMTLNPGDVILTGTPEGVGPIQDGDTIEVEIPGLPVLSNPVEARSLS